MRIVDARIIARRDGAHMRARNGVKRACCDGTRRIGTVCYQMLGLPLAARLDFAIRLSKKPKTEELFKKKTEESEASKPKVGPNTIREKTKNEVFEEI